MGKVRDETPRYAGRAPNGPYIVAKVEVTERRG